MTTILPLYPGLRCRIEKESHHLGRQYISTSTVRHLSLMTKLTKNVVVRNCFFNISSSLLTSTLAHVFFQSLRSQDEEENGYFEEDWQNRNTKLYQPRNLKRARTVSPNSGKRAANVHRSKHEIMKRARMKEEMEARREVRDRKFMREILADVPPCSAQFDGSWFQIVAISVETCV